MTYKKMDDGKMQKKYGFSRADLSFKQKSNSILLITTFVTKENIRNINNNEL
jgi:hypothetical protein